MANTEGMAMKFTVLKNEDIKKTLFSVQLETLNSILTVIKNRRRAEGKKDNTYLVINTDEPYADEVIDILKRYGHWG